MATMRSPALASVVLTAAVAACSPVEPTFIDAAPPIDAPTDIAIGPATITVTFEDQESAPGEPIADARVFFIRPDGTYEIKQTGPDGRASADVVPGSTILTSRPRSLSGFASQRMTVFVGVEPGADIIAGARRPVGYPTNGRVVVSWPQFAGAAAYGLSAPCVSGFPQGTTVALEIQPTCPQVASATLLVTATDQLGEPLAYSVLPDVNLPTVAGTTLTMPGFQTNLGAASITYTGVPAAVRDLDLQLGLRRDGVTYGYLQRYNAPAASGSVTVSGPIAPVGQTTFIRSRMQSTGNFLPMFHLRRQTGQQLTQTTDLATSMIPFTTFPSFDLQSRTVAWTPSGGAAGKVADAVVARGNWLVASRGIQVSFTLIGPPVVSHLTMPALPTELADLIPAATDTGSVDEFWMIDVVGKAGFAAVVRDVDPESHGLYYDETSFSGEPEVYFTGTLPQ